MSAKKNQNRPHSPLEYELSGMKEIDPSIPLPSYIDLLCSGCWPSMNPIPAKKKQTA